MESLTSEFGMGSGVPSPLWLPKKFRGISSNLAALHGSGRLVMGFFAHSLRSRLVRLATFEHLLRNAATQPRCHCQNIETGMEGFSRNKTHGLLVLVSSTPHRASTSSLSTRSSTSALQDLRQGELILRQASRLDAFSGYPFRT